MRTPRSTSVRVRRAQTVPSMRVRLCARGLPAGLSWHAAMRLPAWLGVTMRIMMPSVDGRLGASSVAGARGVAEGPIVVPRERSNAQHRVT